MTFCRPCKAFEKAYKTVATEYPAVKFLRLNGNENRSCTALARDVLGLRSTPAFYFFRPRDGAKPIASHTGANEARLREALERLSMPGAVADAPASAGAATAAVAPPAPPAPKLDAGKIDTSEAKKSGLADLLSAMSVKMAYIDKLKAQIAKAESELAELQKQVEAQTGTRKNTPR